MNHSHSGPVQDPHCRSAEQNGGEVGVGNISPLDLLVLLRLVGAMPLKKGEGEAREEEKESKRSSR